MSNRPFLNTNISIKDFKEHYWYKTELIAFCRTEKLDSRGGKLEIAERIEKYLATGERQTFQKNSPKKSKFDWSSEKLTLKTEITDNYTNTENVRQFFKTQIGERFKFNVKFMNWMKTSQGKLLGDAVNMWLEIELNSKNKNTDKEIAPQFEYNTYIRDFLKDNPEKTLQDAINYWKLKKLQAGSNRYSSNDLK